MSKIKTYDYDGSPITWTFEDGANMVNATEMSKPFEKQPSDFLRLKQTKNYIDAYKKRYGNSPNEILNVRQAGDAKLQGTWMNERLALKFAAWLSPDFELWVYDRIHELLITGRTELVQTDNNAKKSLEWYLRKITYNTDEIRNLLDTIPFQSEDLNRLNYLSDEDKKELGL